MQIFRKILCPIDFSDFSALALRYAAAMARENNAQLVVYHSIPDLVQMLSHLESTYIGMIDELTSGAASRLEKFVRLVVPLDQKVLERIEIGNPADGIVNLAKEGDIDLIVMGTHGHTGYERLFPGSVTNKVLHKSPVTALVVCKQTHHFVKDNPELPVEIKRILCPVDFVARNLEIVSTALSVARQYRSRLYLLHVIEDTRLRKEEIITSLRRLVNSEKEQGCDVQILVKKGEPASVITTLIDQEEIDLLVMGHHARKPIEELFLGSVAKKMVTDSQCPVLVVHSSASKSSDVILI